MRRILVVFSDVNRLVTSTFFMDLTFAFDQAIVAILGCWTPDSKTTRNRKVATSPLKSDIRLSDKPRFVNWVLGRVDKTWGNW